MNEREAKIPAQGKPRLTEALERLVQLYDAWGKPDQAAEWRAKLPKKPENEKKQPASADESERRDKPNS